MVMFIDFPLFFLCFPWDRLLLLVLLAGSPRRVSSPSGWRLSGSPHPSLDDSQDFAPPPKWSGDGKMVPWAGKIWDFLGHQKWWFSMGFYSGLIGSRMGGKWKKWVVTLR